MIEKLLNKMILRHDTSLHALYGLFLYDYLRLFMPDIHAFVIVFFIAVAKEIYDYYNPNHTSDIGDIVATTTVPFSLLMFEAYKHGLF